MSSESSERGLMRISDLVAETGIAPHVLRRLAGQKLIPARRIPASSFTHWRFLRSDLPVIRKVLAESGLIDVAQPEPAGAA